MPKPHVTVIRAQGKPLLVCRSGPRFISAFTWGRLMEKFNNGTWLLVENTTLKDRLP